MNVFDLIIPALSRSWMPSALTAALGLTGDEKVIAHQTVGYAEEE